jgi:hypothetical protein
MDATSSGVRCNLHVVTDEAAVAFSRSKKPSSRVLTVLLGFCEVLLGPPLRSSGHSSWLLTQRSQIRFPALPDFLSSSGSGTGSTQPL